MGTPSITVITPTIRPEGLKLVEKALKRQTFKDFEWVIVKPLAQPEGGGQINSIHLPPFEDAIYFKHIFNDPPKQEGDVWTLNKAYNLAISKAKGTLIVSWQDYTYAKPDILERLWEHYQAEPKTIVGAVGNKYSDDSWTVQTWQDPRENDKHGTFYQVWFSDIEWNLCSVPKEALYAVGGFDEELDKFFGMDGYSVNCRIHLLGGYDFKLDQSIKTYSTEHGRVPDWEAMNAIHGPYQERAKLYVANPTLDYLK